MARSYGGVMQIQDIYTWAAEMADGTVITADSPCENRGDLTECVRFALVPAEGIPFPKHEISGVKMVRRFCRGFHKHQFNRRFELPGKLFWTDGAARMRSTDDWRELLAPGDWIGWGVTGAVWYRVVDVGVDCVTIDPPYSGKTKVNGMFCRMMKNPVKAPTFIYLHCVECADFRVWLNYGTGGVMVTGRTEEVYL